MLCRMAIRVNIVCIVLMHRGLFETGHDSRLSSLSRRGPKAIPGAEPAGPTGGTGLSGSLMPSGAGCFAQTCSLPARPQAQAVGLGNEELQLRHPTAHPQQPRKAVGGERLGQLPRHQAPTNPQVLGQSHRRHKAGAAQAQQGATERGFSPQNVSYAKIWAPSTCGARRFVSFHPVSPWLCPCRGFLRRGTAGCGVTGCRVTGCGVTVCSRCKPGQRGEHCSSPGAAITELSLRGQPSTKTGPQNPQGWKRSLQRGI